MSLNIILLILRVVTVLALYGFLGLMLFYIWHDLRTAGHPVPERQRLAGRLVVIQSDGVGVDLGREYTLQPITTLGRGAGNTIVLPDTSISTEHAAIIWRKGQWWLEDQQSRNGTSVNNIRLTEPIVLGAGDEISVGRFKFRLEVDL